MRKKTTLALVLMMNLACAMAQKTGTTGPLSWNYNETSKELTITGNGAMPNYDYGAKAPLRDAPAWRASLCQRNWRPSADSPSPTAWPWLAWTSPPT